MKRIITYGTFDLFHQGHYNIIKRAKEYGDYLIVGVTSESFDIERGKLGVRDSLATRIENVKNTGFADEIIIEEFQGQKIQDVQKYGIDAIVIGSDWLGKFDYLKPYCEVVYLDRTKNISSTQLRMENQLLQLGVVIADAEYDDSFVEETKFVSGIHVDAVFSEDQLQADRYAQEKEINHAHSNYARFLEGVDAVYVSVKEHPSRIREALWAGKHVLSSFPMAGSAQQAQELMEIARQKRVILLDCMIPAYLNAFNQLLWRLETGEIGNIINVKCAISNMADHALDWVRSCYYALYAVHRVYAAKQFEYSAFQHITDSHKRYGCIIMQTEGGNAFLEIGHEMPLSCGLTIYGEKGKVTVPDDWWNTGYFELNFFDSAITKRFSYNYDGSGMRYILRELLIMLREENYESAHFTNGDIIALHNMYTQVNTCFWGNKKDGCGSSQRN